MMYYVVKGPPEAAHVLSAHRMIRAAVKSLDRYDVDVGAYVRRARPPCRRLYAGERVDFATFQMDTETVSSADLALARRACYIRRGYAERD